LGSSELQSDGFPGYTAHAWMFRNTDGRLVHNSQLITTLNFHAEAQQKKMVFTCDQETGYIRIQYDGKKYEYIIEGMPKELYFVFAITGGIITVHY